MRALACVGGLVHFAGAIEQPVLADVQCPADRLDNDALRGRLVFFKIENDAAGNADSRRQGSLRITLALSGIFQAFAHAIQHHHLVSTICKTIIIVNVFLHCQCNIFIDFALTLYFRCAIIHSQSKLEGRMRFADSTGENKSGRRAH